MTAIRVEAGRGWGWIVEGWQLFAKAPGVWIVILLIYLGISVVLSLIPFVGGMAYMLLSPVLAGGMLYGAAALARGKRWKSLTCSGASRIRSGWDRWSCWA